MGSFLLLKYSQNLRSYKIIDKGYVLYIFQPPSRFMTKYSLWILLFSDLFLSSFSNNLFTAKRTAANYIKSDTLTPFTIHAKDHKSLNVINRDRYMSLTSGLDNDYFYSDSTGRVGYLYIETNVGSPSTTLKRTPLNIAIVIDRSGSMGEDREDKKPFSKIEYAKKAAKLIVDKLDSNDYVSVTVYDNFVNVIQKATLDTSKNEIKRRIDKISPRGATDLWGGTEKGYKEAMNFYEAGRINRVLLLSDGQANVGLTDTRQICKKVQQYRDSGISISTFGVGLDYNELLMTQMAEYGSGNYYFIDSAGKITGLFDKELNSLLHVAAQNAELKVKIPPGIKIEEAYPYKFDIKSGELSIRFEDLSQLETLGVLIKYRITDGYKQPLKFTTTLSYVDVTDKQKKLLVNEQSCKPIKDKNLYLTHFNRDVIDQAIFFTANDHMETAMDLADAGNYSDAKTYLNSNHRFLASNSDYISKSTELQKMDSVNNRYAMGLSRVNLMSKDSINWMQKINRNTVYKLKFKKKN
jgi:Ca-activated chloride channel family protein